MALIRELGHSPVSAELRLKGTHDPHLFLATMFLPDLAESAKLLQRFAPTANRTLAMTM